MQKNMVAASANKSLQFRYKKTYQNTRPILPHVSATGISFSSLIVGHIS